MLFKTPHIDSYVKKHLGETPQKLKIRLDYRLLMNPVGARFKATKKNDPTAKRASQHKEITSPASEKSVLAEVATKAATTIATVSAFKHSLVDSNLRISKADEVKVRRLDKQLGRSEQERVSKLVEPQENGIGVHSFIDEIEARIKSNELRNPKQDARRDSASTKFPIEEIGNAEEIERKIEILRLMNGNLELNPLDPRLDLLDPRIQHFNLRDVESENLSVEMLESNGAMTFDIEAIDNYVEGHSESISPELHPNLPENLVPKDSEIRVDIGSLFHSHFLEIEQSLTYLASRIAVPELVGIGSESLKERVLAAQLLVIETRNEIAQLTQEGFASLEVNRHSEDSVDPHQFDIERRELRTILKEIEISSADVILKLKVIESNIEKTGEIEAVNREACLELLVEIEDELEIMSKREVDIVSLVHPELLSTQRLQDKGMILYPKTKRN